MSSKAHVSTNGSRGARVLAAALLALAASLGSAGCKSVDAKVWNLDQLHDGDSHHRYHGALEGDIEFFLRHRVTQFVSAAGARFAQKEASRIDDPSQSCLEMLVELERIDTDDVRARALQVEWASRLCVHDPASLSRERAAYALGRFGARIAAGAPSALPATPPPATADAVAGAATAVVRAVRGVVDPASLKGEPAGTVADACAAVEALVLDVEGGRRALNAVGQLADVRGLDGASRERLAATALELERRLVRQGIAIAINDREPRVRAAAVSAAVATGGARVLDGFLLTLHRQDAPLVVLRVLDLVRTHGLGDAPPGASAEEAARRHEAQLDALYNVLLTRPASDVRVAAMRALGRVADAGFESLREEDWQAWWSARRATASAPAKDASRGANGASNSGERPAS